MKKFMILLLAAIMMAGTSMAQTGQKRQVPLPGTTTSVVKLSPGTLPKAEWQRQQNGMSAMSQMLQNHEYDGFPQAPWQQKIRKAEDVAAGYYITERPEGESVTYVRSADSYDLTAKVYEQRVSGLVGEVVFGTSGEVYVRNIISSTQNSFKNWAYWIRGKLEGSTITFEVPVKMGSQAIFDFSAALLRYDAEYKSYYYDPTLTSFTMNYDAATGAITLPAGSELATGDVILGQVFASDGEWMGAADWNFAFETFADDPVTAPDGMTTEQYALTAKGFTGCPVQVGFSGDDIYVQGLFPNLPEAWVKGTISGDKVIFSNGQYLGIETDAFNRGFFRYLVAADEVGEGYSLTDEDIVFDYDASTKMLTNGTTFLVNSNKKEVKEAQVCINAKIAPFTEVPATPAPPEWIELYEGGYMQFSYYYDWGYVHFNTPSQDVDGNFILPDKLSYALWARTNGEEKQIVFTKEKYSYRFLEETMEEIPFGYVDGWNGYDIGLEDGGIYAYYYVIGPEAFGLQAIYRGGGEEHRSEIAWKNVQTIGAELQPEAATPEYPEVAADNVGNSITFSYYTGEEDTQLFGEHKVQTYDVAMKVQDTALVGAHIDNIIIPLQGLESMKNVKVWLSSQLRVENNVNVPDIVSIDVTPEEEGFVSVALPKPYVIPENGVYVGYSVSIDEVDTEAAATPIVTFLGGRPGGLCLHTSNGFLKWLDVSEQMGKTAMIQIVVSGKDVKGEAASPKAGELAYVKAGDPIEMPITFVNHGSNGIQSLDVEYTLNGTTTTDHIVLDKPVKGVFGLTCTTMAALPAVPTRGNYDLSVKVTKVNDVENGDANPVAVTPIAALSTVPKHRTLMEEYTGTWCGYCVRGLLGLQKLAELYPDDYVCVSYHNGDPMEITYYFPSNVEGYPDAWVDRQLEVDAYYGYNENYGITPMGIADVMAERAKIFGQAGIDIETNFNGDDDVVDVKTTLTFPFSTEEATFALEYILIADGLTGEGADWAQSNYYSGGSMGELGGFEDMDEHISGWVFNDVVVMKSWDGGEWESVPATVTADQPITHEYSFNLAEALNTNGEPVIQDKSKLRVVVLLINTTTGEVCNANQVKVGENTGIVTAGSDYDNIRSIEYFDLSGRKLNRAEQGVNIMRINYNNGKSKSIKVLRK